MPPTTAVSQPWLDRTQRLETALTAQNIDALILNPGGGPYTLTGPERALVRTEV